MKVAALQMVSATEIERNIDVTKELVLQAAEQNAELIVLPENFLTYGLKQALSDDDQWEYIMLMSQLAQDHGITIVAGTLPLNQHVLAELVFGFAQVVVNPLPYAATLVFDPQGECIGVYTKLHLFDVNVDDGVKNYRESSTYRHGEAPAVFRCQQQYFGIAVCYDVRFPELFRFFTDNKAKAVCIPSAFTAKTGEAHWEVLVRARAIETQSYIIAANQGGKHDNGRETSGNSMIVDPWGRILTSIDRGEGVISADIDFAYVDECRSAMPISEHRRL